MNDDFCAFILTHKRPTRQSTLSLLRRRGYSGRIVLVVDDMDPTLGEYEQLYPGMVTTFSKRDAWAITDDADNSGSMAGVVYARNMIWKIAADLGVKHFIMLDDDYTSLALRFEEDLEYVWLKTGFDKVLPEMIRWLESDPRILSVAMSQGGDHIGGGSNCKNKSGPAASRKAMNTFVCATDRPFKFLGRINEDTTAYVVHGNRGGLFFTVQQLQVVQIETQQNSGGLTEIYKDSGTYYKSFLSVMYAPSCVRVSAMGSHTEGVDAKHRIHHAIDWRKAVPCILPHRFRKDPGPGALV